MKITIARRLPDFSSAPFGYRLAYYDFQGEANVYYPIGIHWLVMAVRLLWRWSFWHPRVIQLRDQVEIMKQEVTRTRVKNEEIKRKGIAKVNQLKKKIRGHERKILTLSNKLEAQSRFLEEQSCEMEKISSANESLKQGNSNLFANIEYRDKEIARLVAARNFDREEMARVKELLRAAEEVSLKL